MPILRTSAGHLWYRLSKILSVSLGVRGRCFGEQSKGTMQHRIARCHIYNLGCGLHESMS